MSRFKRIVTQILAFVICISLCVTSVFAEWYNKLAYDYTQSTLAQFIVGSILSAGGGAIGSIFGHPVAGTFIGDALNAGITDLASALAAGYDPDDIYDLEDDYVSSLDNVLISSSDTSLNFALSLSPESLKVISDGINSGTLLSYSESSSFFEITYGVCTESKYFSAGLEFISSPFSVDEPLNFKINLSPYDVYGFNIAYFYLARDISGSRYSVSEVTTNSSYESAPGYYYGKLSYKSGSFSVSLIPGYNYYFVLKTKDFWFRPSRDYPNSDYGFKSRIDFPSISLSSDKTVVSSPASTRLSSYIQNVYNYNQTDSSTKYYIGKVDNSNNVTNVYNVNIFDETTNEFRNPYTDKPYQVTDWTYDYAQRIYYLTLADDSLLYNGTPVKHLAIWYANDAMYYIGLDDTFVVGEPYLDHIIFLDPFQYVIAEEKEDSGTGSDGHKHVFTSETTTPPSCTGTGVRTYTCQFCDYSYDEIIPAAGHQWEVTEVKDTEFNDNGDVTAAGYTLYTCAVCGETYKQWSNTGQPGPPTGNTGTGSGGGSSGSGSGSSGEGSSFWEKIKDAVFGVLGDLLEAALSLITDVLSAVLGLVKDLLSFFFGFLSDTVIKGITDLFSAFGSIKLELPDGVASVFGFFSGVILALPVEVKSLMIFGVAALFLIAIFKLVKA